MKKFGFTLAEGATHVETWKSKCKFAFTLAEILITLGIIGVIASITIPALIKNYQKTVTVNRLKSSYTTLYQAIRLSEIDNGNITEWNYPEAKNLVEHKEWLDKYICPYLKYIKTETDNEAIYLYLVNGTKIKFYRYRDENYMNVFITLLAKNPQKGKEIFYFYLGKNSDNRKNQELRPYDAGISDNSKGRNVWLNGYCACTKQGSKQFCAGLIIEDGWKISDDYPW